MSKWYDVPGFEGRYQITKDAQLRSLSKGYRYKKIIKSYIEKNGNERVYLWDGSKMHRKLLYRVVAETFIPNPNNYKYVLHIGDKKDSSLSNLMWGERKAERTYNWKAEKASYRAKHYWMKNNFGKADRCENSNCKYKNPKRYEWANISGNYIRELHDWMKLCPSCHRKMDLGLITIERELVNAWIEEERQPSGEPQQKLGKIVLERTEIAQQAFEAVGEI